MSESEIFSSQIKVPHEARVVNALWRIVEPVTCFRLSCPECDLFLREMRSTALYMQRGGVGRLLAVPLIYCMSFVISKCLGLIFPVNS